MHGDHSSILGGKISQLLRKVKKKKKEESTAKISLPSHVEHQRVKWLYLMPHSSWSNPEECSLVQGRLHQLHLPCYQWCQYHHQGLWHMQPAHWMDHWPCARRQISHRVQPQLWKWIIHAWRADIILSRWSLLWIIAYLQVLHVQVAFVPRTLLVVYPVWGKPAVALTLMYKKAVHLF